MSVSAERFLPTSSEPVTSVTAAVEAAAAIALSDTDCCWAYGEDA